jgi:hypothetical protein
MVHDSKEKHAYGSYDFVVWSVGEILSHPHDSHLSNCLLALVTVAIWIHKIKKMYFLCCCCKKKVEWFSPIPYYPCLLRRIFFVCGWGETSSPKQPREKVVILLAPQVRQWDSVKSSPPAFKKEQGMFLLICVYNSLQCGSLVCQFPFFTMQHSHNFFLLFQHTHKTKRIPLWLCVEMGNNFTSKGVGMTLDTLEPKGVVSMKDQILALLAASFVTRTGSCSPARILTKEDGKLIRSFLDRRICCIIDVSTDECHMRHVRVSSLSMAFDGRPDTTLSPEVEFYLWELLRMFEPKDGRIGARPEPLCVWHISPLAEPGLICIDTNNEAFGVLLDGSKTRGLWTKNDYTFFTTYGTSNIFMKILINDIPMTLNVLMMTQRNDQDRDPGIIVMRKDGCWIDYYAARNDVLFPRMVVFNGCDRSKLDSFLDEMEQIVSHIDVVPCIELFGNIIPIPHKNPGERMTDSVCCVNIELNNDETIGYVHRITPDRQCVLKTRSTCNTSIFTARSKDGSVFVFHFPNRHTLSVALLSERADTTVPPPLELDIGFEVRALECSLQESGISDETKISVLSLGIHGTVCIEPCFYSRTKCYSMGCAYVFDREHGTKDNIRVHKIAMCKHTFSSELVMPPPPFVGEGNISRYHQVYAIGKTIISYDEKSVCFYDSGTSKEVDLPCSGAPEPIHTAPLIGQLCLPRCSGGVKRFFVPFS